MRKYKIGVVSQQSDYAVIVDIDTHKESNTGGNRHIVSYLILREDNSVLASATNEDAAADIRNELNGLLSSASRDEH
jgi:hypothetical protein